MTLQQGLAFAIVGAMMALFVWGRLRYDLVAMLALLAAVAVGIVPPEKAFAGFGDDIVVIVATALLVSAAVARSGITERLIAPLAPRLTTAGRQVLVLVAAVTLLSAFVKNVGALAILMPIAFQLARRTGTSPSSLLMPLSFGSLLGGLMTLIGTSPNVIVSRMRSELLGEPFRMFDFMPVGVGIAAAGVLFLAFGYRLLPTGRKGTASIDAAFNIEGYTTEAIVPPDSPTVGKSVTELETLGEGEVAVTTVIRERFRRYAPSSDWQLLANDVLLLQGEPAALERLVARAKLQLATKAAAPEAAASDEIGVMEAVVTADSLLVDRSPTQLALRRRYQVNLLAVSRRGERVIQRLRSVKFRPGDVLALQGDLNTMPDTLGELRLLPLAQRGVSLGRGRSTWLPVAILATAMLLVALQIVPVAVAFFGAATAILLFRVISLREAYEVVEWPILILLGALIPVSEALHTTGGTELIAGWLSTATHSLPPLAALALIVMVAMAVTPFLNNAATVLMMAPIAASLAKQLGLDPDPFLMAVAVGAACDFLTPIGHQCNTLVMGPGGYRFDDYWKLGLPLSIIVIVVGVPLIALVWPLRPG
ncbi:SLC13 family permease [Benzoatithermus flavus]|uniref:SLC13 family permease n=1 Tax=Benzoatithermus flavus TaxID=3108223 RepID=A0ABU8XTJ8_9PROT